MDDAIRQAVISAMHNRGVGWLDDPELSDRERAIDADELVRIGSLLKQRCDELAMISRLVATQMRLRDNSPGQ
jgi:hypothetical protein